VEKPLVIYRSSAGSGKTRTLAKEYLKLALRYKAGYFRHILAVTFTNKATQEMKERIVRYLNDFIDGLANPLAEELKQELGFDDFTFLQNCNELRTQILHQYSQFSISTIDAFFQKVIRSFTREAGLSGDYRLEVDHDAVLEEVINNLMDDLDKDDDLRRWMVEFSIDNLESDKPWDIRRSLHDFAREIMGEEFKSIEEELTAKTGGKNFYTNLIKKLNETKWTFIRQVQAKAKEGLKIIADNHFERSDFKYGGVAFNFLVKLSKINQVHDFELPGVRITSDSKHAINWPQKDSLQFDKLLSVAEKNLIPLVSELLEFREKYYVQALSAEVVLQNFYAFGLMADISRKLRDYKAENNMMLLSDAPKLLNGLIGDSDAPFIYEKTGSFYKHYLIDEFQDTSNMQWNNFLPLINESISNNNRNIIVGDVKQAIYRWRGGDLTLLQEKLTQQVGQDQVSIKNLSDNFRSAENIITFNNKLFHIASQYVSGVSDTPLASQAYQDVSQNFRRKDKGYVDIQFIEGEEDLKWHDVARQRVVQTLEDWQRAGIPLKDIAILVRNNREGQELVAHLLQYKNSPEVKEDCKYDVISNESLRIDGAASVNLLLAAMRYLHNHLDVVARAELAYEFSRIHQSGMALSDVFSVSSEAVFESFLPNDFIRQKRDLKKLPLYELSETLIQIFRLSDQVGELAYLQAFQDLVLTFYARERNDLQAFLEWWEENKDSDKTSLKTSGKIDAAQIITIHKAKGLQFKYVIIPFCSWSLDHGNKAPNIWVKADSGIFKDAGNLSVKYSSKLKDTYFNPYYQHEHTQILLDNINIMYVAFTRAEQGLMILAPFKKLNKDGELSIKTVGDLLRNAITSDEALNKHWDETTLRWSVSALDYVPDSSGDEVQETISLKGYPVSRWRDKLVIRSSGKSYFDSDKQQEKVLYGIHVHGILSFIHTHDDIKEALLRAIREGLLTTAEMDSVKQELIQLLSQPLVSSWFEKGWEVRTEVPVLLPGGEESRFDRLLIRDNQAVVIDFKTGTPTKADQQQVMAYMEVLRKMNYSTVEGYVLYVRTGEVVEVKPGKVKVIKKKDDSQLDLGI